MDAVEPPFIGEEEAEEVWASTSDLLGGAEMHGKLVSHLLPDDEQQLALCSAHRSSPEGRSKVTALEEEPTHGLRPSPRWSKPGVVAQAKRRWVGTVAISARGHGADDRAEPWHHDNASRCDDKRSARARAARGRSTHEIRNEVEEAGKGNKRVEKIQEMCLP